MAMQPAAKAAAFCRELDDTALSELAREQGLGAQFRRADKALRAGALGPGLEADLDALDAMLRQVEGQGLYPSQDRTYPGPLPGSEPDRGAGARWWTCPRGWCSGRGRVRPGQQAPECAAAGEPLSAGPFP
ncbi:hypothetical protein KDL01_20065 [Actinospica durhamensis]|uniref:Uncharacterized protein n=1 Tax=Actinospica durhamensis TaxID=1508375 RepID=A0A941ER46_9ACTN|nr:hypothetical protein [Actinospica durhamensis]MBR7835581.1 hypothetical protein [Actinospica durhamensis]